MDKKLLVASFVSIVVLLVVAGAIELLMAVLPASSGDDGTVENPQVEVESSEDLPLLENRLPTEEEKEAAQLVKSGAIVLDGASLARKEAEEIVTAAKPFASRVEYIDQLPILPSGCEIVSLAVALKAEGYDADPVVIADEHLRLGGDFATDYVGTPRDYGGGLPPCIVDAGNSWLAAKGLDARAFDLTGTTFQGVADLVELGYPVLVWTTEGLVSPALSGLERNGLRWYDFEHCVVVCGVGEGEVLVADPLAGLVTRDRAAFERVYEGCGNMAAFVLP